MASRLGLRSGTARRGKPLCKCNATTKAVEGNLGGFLRLAARVLLTATAFTLRRMLRLTGPDLPLDSATISYGPALRQDRFP
jgi:hypothetical protein